jgi:hypothetical protein
MQEEKCLQIDRFLVLQYEGGLQTLFRPEHYLALNSFDNRCNPHAPTHAQSSQPIA